MGDCLERIRHTGDSFILTKNKTPIAELSPLAHGKKGTLGEFIESLRALPSDPDFANDIEKMSHSDEPMPNPWS